MWSVFTYVILLNDFGYFSNLEKRFTYNFAHAFKK